MPVWAWFMLAAVLAAVAVLCLLHGLWFCAAAAGILFLGVAGAIVWAMWVGYRSTREGDQA